MAHDAGYRDEEAEMLARELEIEEHKRRQQEEYERLEAERQEKLKEQTYSPNDSRVEGQIVTLLAEGEFAPKIRDQRGHMRESMWAAERERSPDYLDFYESLLLDDTVAIIDKGEFAKLRDDTLGTSVAAIGVRPGRVWKARMERQFGPDGFGDSPGWHLKFLVAIEGNDRECYVVSRRLLTYGSREFYEWLDPDLWRD